MNTWLLLMTGFLWQCPPALLSVQATTDGHAAHHGGQSAPPTADSRQDNGGMMKGGMGKMMEQMGAPKPKETWPRLMELPDLPPEKRAEIQTEAHERMIEGVRLMSDGLERLTAAAARQQFAAMQEATATVREGLERFDSGLSAHRAIAEGQAPRNTALHWFRKQMDLLPPPPPSQTWHVFGMSPFHTLVMVLLTVFAVAVIWMYYFKMKRAAALLESFAAVRNSPPDAPLAAADQPSDRSPQPAAVAASVPPASALPVPGAGDSTAEADSSRNSSDPPGSPCCSDTEETCPDEADNSGGLLPVSRRKLCRLKVARIVQETPDVKTFRLVACHRSGLPFSYLPGQFLTLTLPVGEKPIRRSYTISSSPTQGCYCEITVKREEHGLGSRWLHDHVQPGDLLDVRAPSGKFFFTGTESDSVVLIGGGVGITPMMSIVRALTDMCWEGDIWMIVACRDPDHFIFQAELNRLSQEYANLHLHAAMSRIDRDQGICRRGRLSRDMLKEWVPDIASRRIHLCGAPPMMESTRALLEELHVPPENIFTENFGSTRKPDRTKKQPPAAAVPETGAQVTFAASGKTAVLQSGETILEAAERIGVDISYSCRVGTCGECAVRLLKGDVTMEEDAGLDPEDREAGRILACQARCSSPVTVDA